MMKTKRFGIAMAIGICALVAGMSMGGPPLICHPFETNNAKSLPWKGGAFEVSKRYDTSKVVSDTVKLLDEAPSVLARMETIRRAVIYVSGHDDLAAQLLARLASRALDSEARGEPSAEVWFDAGFLAASYSQVDVGVGFAPGEAEGAQGYGWLLRAIELSGGDGQMEYAAALVVHPRMRSSKRDLFEKHMGRAIAASKPGSLLAKNLESYMAWSGESLNEIRADREGRGGGS